MTHELLFWIFLTLLIIGLPIGFMIKPAFRNIFQPDCMVPPPILQKGK